MQASQRRELLLEGQLMQESALAEELRKCEAAQELQMQDLQASVAATLAARVEAAGSLATREKEFLCEALEARAEEEAQELRCSIVAQELEELEQAEAVRQLEDLEAVTRQLGALLKTRGRQAKAALAMAEAIATQLSAPRPCLEEEDFEPSVLAHLAQIPRIRVSSVDQVLSTLEEERDAVEDALRSGGPRVEAARAEVENLQQHLARLEQEAEGHSRALADVYAEEKALDEELEDVDDRLAEVARLRQEIGLLQRQQAEWKRTEVRRQQLRQMSAASLRGIRAVEPRQVAAENSALRQRARQLEEEKEDLFHTQEGLVSFIRSKLPSPQAYPPSP